MGTPPPADSATDAAGEYAPVAGDDLPFNDVPSDNLPALRRPSDVSRWGAPAPGGAQYGPGGPAAGRQGPGVPGIPGAPGNGAHEGSGGGAYRGHSPGPSGGGAYRGPSGDATREYNTFNGFNSPPPPSTGQPSSAQRQGFTPPPPPGFPSQPPGFGAQPPGLGAQPPGLAAQPAGFGAQPPGLPPQPQGFTPPPPGLPPRPQGFTEPQGFTPPPPGSEPEPPAEDDGGWFSVPSRGAPPPQPEASAPPRPEQPAARPSSFAQPDRRDEARGDLGLPVRSDHPRLDQTRFDQPRLDETRFDQRNHDQRNHDQDSLHQTRLDQPRAVWMFRDTDSQDSPDYQRDGFQDFRGGPSGNGPGAAPSPLQAGFQSPASRGGPGNGFGGYQQETFGGNRHPDPFRENYGPPGPFAGNGGQPGQYGAAGYGGMPPQAGPYQDGPYQDGPYQDGGPGARPDGRTRGRRTPLIIGIGALVVIIGVAAVEAPKFLKSPSDPGCTAYTTNALSAYDQAITELNAQAAQATLSSDLATASSQLSAALGQAQGTSVRTALQNLLTQVTVVRADVQKGKVSSSTVAALNKASTAVDNAC